MDYTAVTLAVIAGVVSLVPAFWNYKLKKTVTDKDLKIRQLTVELKLQSDALDFKVILKHINEIQWELSTIMTETNVDRFLMLHAWNGMLDPKYTTAVYQYRQGEQKPVSYIRLEFDEDYKDRLVYICTHKKLYFNVGDLDSCDIKHIYEAEGVSSSLWMHVLSHTDNETGGTSINYCSFASHDAEPMSAATQMRCALLAGRLTSLYEQALDRRTKTQGLSNPDNTRRNIR